MTVVVVELVCAVVIGCVYKAMVTVAVMMTECVLLPHVHTSVSCKRPWCSAVSRLEMEIRIIQTDAVVWARYLFRPCCNSNQ